MITLFGDGINTKFTVPMCGCRVFATAKNGIHEVGEFLGIVTKIDGNQIHVKNKGETSVYLWRFPKGGKNEWIEFGA